MFPVLLMMWTLSKVVHHSSPCCSTSNDADRYYENDIGRYYDNELWKNKEDCSALFCLPHGRDPSETRQKFHIDTMGLDWVDSDANKKYSSQSEPDKDVDVAAIAGDPAVQMIPSEHVNTDNEIVVISGNENENEDLLAGLGGSSVGSEEFSFDRKYE